MRLTSIAVFLTTTLLFGVIPEFGTPLKNSANPAFFVIEIPFEETNNWGTWKMTSCYKGIDYRVEYRGETYSGKHKWGVQFQNRYYEKVYFNYDVYNSKPYNPRTSRRTSLDPDEVSSGYSDFYMSNGNSIYIYVDKVRFGSDGLQDYYSCDR